MEEEGGAGRGPAPRVLLRFKKEGRPATGCIMGEPGGHDAL